MASSALQPQTPNDVLRTPEMLPQELVEQVVDALADDQDSLIACGLAGRVFVERTRFHLFSTVAIHGFAKPNRHHMSSSKALYDLIDASPRVTLFVQHFQLDINISYQTQESQDVIQDPRLISTLMRFVGLKSFSLSLGAGGSWNALPTPFADCLKTIFSRPSMETVRLMAVEDIPLNIFENCTNLKNITSFYASFSGPYERTPSAERVSLQSLKYHKSRIFNLPGNFGQLISFSEDPAAVLDLTKLQHLSLEWQPNDNADALSRLFDACGDSLTDMIFDLASCESTAGSSASFNFQGLKHLRKLSFLFYMFEPPNEDRVKELLCAVLPTIRSSSLEEICVELPFSAHQDVTLPIPTWKELDNTLSAPNLKKSQITFRNKVYWSAEGSIDAGKTAIAQGLAASLPRLHSTGRMVIEFDSF